MWRKFEKRAQRLNTLATASSMGMLLMLVQGTAMAAQETAANQGPTLDTVVVTGAQASGALKAEKALKKVAGNTAVVDNHEVERGRAANAEDVLALQPGSEQDFDSRLGPQHLLSRVRTGDQIPL